MEKKREIKNFIWMETLIIIVVFICCNQNSLRSYNSTMLALSYEYGFTSRSLLGTIYHVLDFILPINMMQYSVALAFGYIVTGLLGLFLLFFSKKALETCDESVRKPTEYLLFAFSFVTVATFSCGYNFLRVDLFLLIVAMLSVQIFVLQKHIWLLIPLSAVGVMFHQGFVLMYFNVALVLLFYGFLSAREKKKRRYFLFVFAVAFLLGSALFLWFELFSRTNGNVIIDHVIKEARSLSYQGKYHSTLLAHEVLGVELATQEFEWHKINFEQLPFFIFASLPILVLMLRFFKRIIKKAASGKDKVKYFIVAIGSFTMIPDLLLKIDYGRWMMAIISYYILIILALLMLKDEIVCETVLELEEHVRMKPYWFLFFVYLAFFVPLWDVDINVMSQKIATWLDANIFHWIKL